MDVLPSGGIFRELQVVHDTGYFSGQASLEEDWHQVDIYIFLSISFLSNLSKVRWNLFLIKKYSYGRAIEKNKNILNFLNVTGGFKIFNTCDKTLS